MWTERDTGLLSNKVMDLNNSNTQLQNSNTSDKYAINDLILYDIPFKKQLDPKHYNIYAYEEELRMLTGRTTIGPVQEDAFTITVPFEDNIQIKIVDGRFQAFKNNVTIVDVSIIPSRGFIVGSSCGPNFDIWTRDRYGSSTSDLNVPQSYTINNGNNKFTAIIDSKTYQINIIDPAVLAAQNGSLTVSPFVISSSITQSFNNLSTALSKVQCIYNGNRQTFTLVSGTTGPNSTIKVIVDNTNDLSAQMKFTNQTMVPGRFANNELKINIDGVVQKIALTSDIRIPTYSKTLGYALDDFSADWRTDFSIGPLFPAKSNNGATIATMIQTQIRQINMEGFQNAECIYYSDSRKFIIYSGTFGTDDYLTLNDLYNYLNSNTSIQCTNLANPTKNTHSLLYLDDISISNQQFRLQTTTEYDNAHLALPRLYGNKLAVDVSNNMFDLNDGTGNITITIPDGMYAESDLAEIIQDMLSTASSKTYTVTYKRRLQQFTIQASANITLLLNTGLNKATSITTFMGYTNTSDQTGTSFVSNAVSFSGIDYFSMAQIPQLVPQSHFNYLPPYYIDYEYGEQNWLTLLNIILGAESGSNTSVLNALNTQTDFNNEVYLNQWEMLASLETSIESEQYEALRQEAGFYSRINTTDTNYQNITTAISSDVTNKNNLQLFSPHASILDITSANHVFEEGTDFHQSGTDLLTIPTVGTTDNIVIYNRPYPIFTYVNNDKFIPMFNSTRLYNPHADFKLFNKTAFTIERDKIATSGYALSNPSETNLFNITVPNDTAASLLSSNSGPYNLSSADEISVSIDGLPVANATFVYNAAYLLSSDVLSDGSFTITANNDMLDYNDGTNKSITIPVGTYKGTALAVMITTALQTQSPTDGFNVSWSSNQFTISSSSSITYKFASGSHASTSIGKMIGFTSDITNTSITGSSRNIYVQQNINNDFSLTINGLSTGDIVIPENNYTISSLISELQSLLGSIVIVTNSSQAIKISTVKRGQSASISGTIGIHDFLRTVYLSTVTPVQGSGDILDITNVTAAEISNKITASFPNLTSTSQGEQLIVSTTSTSGQLSVINFSSNAFSTLVGLVGVVTGINENNKISIKINEEDPIILSLTTSSQPISGPNVATDIQNKLQALGTEPFINCLVLYNGGNFSHEFKIISGTTGSNSKVAVSKSTIIITNANHHLDFKESPFVLTATIANGTYDGVGLATAIINALEDVGSSSYIATYDDTTEKITILSDLSGGSNIFSILFGSGPSTSSSIASTIGFFKIDHSGSNTYTSPTQIKLQEVVTELGYDGSPTPVDGYDIVDARLILTSDYIQSIVWKDKTTSTTDFQYDFSDVIDVYSLVNKITTEQPGYTAAIVAELWSQYPEQFTVFNGDSFMIQVGSNIQQSVSFNATNGVSYSNVSPSNVVVVGDTLTLSINGESKTITMPTNTMNPNHTASIIQLLVRCLIANNVQNQPAYTNFICSYLNGLYYLYSGTQGTSSSVHVEGGTLKTSLKLGSHETIGTGDFANNYFVTCSEIISKLSTLTDIQATNDNSHLKISASAELTISQTDLAARLGFLSNNIICNPVSELPTVNCNTLQTFSNVSILQHDTFSFNYVTYDSILTTETIYALDNNDIIQLIGDSLPTPLQPLTNYFVITTDDPTKIQLTATLGGSAIPLSSSGSGSIQPIFMLLSVYEGYEQDNIIVNYYTTNYSLILSREITASTRQSYLSERLSQISPRVTQIQTALSQQLYLDRWTAIQKRLNKNTGSYYIVGTKEQNVANVTQQISNNNSQVSEIQGMLS